MTGPAKPGPDATEALLERLQRESFRYFAHETDAASGLVPDTTVVGSPASIAAMGLALTAYPVAVARGFTTRDEACGITLATLRFLWNSPQGPEHDAAGHHGFYYHFLDMRTGRRTWNCELSTIDTALLMAGVLAAAASFDGASSEETEIRSLAEALYERVDWPWALNGGLTLTMGWKPESGFLRHRWTGYDEALLLYALGLGSPTFPLPAASYAAWCATYRWKRLYGREYLHAGPLFIHQLSHVWIDFREIQDAFMREKGMDYFENSRRATLLQQEYAIRNPRGFAGYGALSWGLTASDGPGPASFGAGRSVRRFAGYLARGIPFGPDDGTLAPWAAVASLPFAPEVVLPTIEALIHERPAIQSAYGLLGSFNPSFPSVDGKGWVASSYFGLNEGPIVLMIENHRSGLIWRLMRGSPHLVSGLRRAGFRGGWLER
ncbi:MAG: glucoamylase family protein [Thermoanaerobaculia bacterium]